MNDESLSEREVMNGEAGLVPRIDPSLSKQSGASRSESDEEAHPGYYGNGLLTRLQIDYLAWLFTGGIYKPRDR